MKHPKTFDYQCDDCEEIEILLVAWEARDDPPPCNCGGKRTRQWSANFSTEKLSQSLPAEVAKLTHSGSQLGIGVEVSRNSRRDLRVGSSGRAESVARFFKIIWVRTDKSE